VLCTPSVSENRSPVGIRMIGRAIARRSSSDAIADAHASISSPSNRLGATGTRTSVIADHTTPVLSAVVM
jgi:hypothetical protein